jgi:hypothetical protein
VDFSVPISSTVLELAACLEYVVTSVLAAEVEFAPLIYRTLAPIKEIPLSLVVL